MREPGYSLVTLERDPNRFARSMLAVAVLSVCAEGVRDFVGGRQAPAQVTMAVFLLFMAVVAPQVMTAPRWTPAVSATYTGFENGI